MDPQEFPEAKSSFSIGKIGSQDVKMAFHSPSMDSGFEPSGVPDGAGVPRLPRVLGPAEASALCPGKSLQFW